MNTTTSDDRPPGDQSLTSARKKDPVTLALEVYANEVSRRSFGEDFYLHWHTPGCIVHKDADSLAFVRPVNASDPYRILTDASHVSERPDAWWIHLLVGDFHRLIAYLPYPLAKIGWERKNRPRFYNFEKLTRWTQADHTTQKIFSGQMEG